MSNTTPGGIAAEHAVRVKLPVFVGPTTAKDFNTVRPRLLPIACWRLEDLRFDFDSSFVAPEAKKEMGMLAALFDKCGHPPLSVFGHADPTGDDAYNKKLSGRRARAVHALLLREVDAWEDLYSNPQGGDDWGTRAVQRMLNAVGYSCGIPDGKKGPATRQAIKTFQADQGLSADGDAGKDTRKVLFQLYMDAICQRADGSEFKLAADNFLGRGADADGKGDLQGCGEFNPVLVFSKEEDDGYKPEAKHPQRDADNLPNRRVLVFLFPPGSVIETSKWPCPTHKEGGDGCKKHFWPDGDKRRSVQEKRRRYSETHDTVACRFYDEMARRSPCELSRQTLMTRLLDSENSAIPNAPYRVNTGDGETREGTADENGWLVEQNVLAPSRVEIEWGYPPSDGLTSEERAKRWTMVGPYEYSISVILDPDDAASDEQKAKNHLLNLGYPADRTLGENLVAFKRDFQVFPIDDQLDDAAKAAIDEVTSEFLSREEYIARHGGDANG